MDTARCYKFRLDPTPVQGNALIYFAGCRRFVGNWALTRKREVYQGNGIGYSMFAAEMASFLC